MFSAGRVCNSQQRAAQRRFHRYPLGKDCKQWRQCCSKSPGRIASTAQPQRQRQIPHCKEYRCWLPRCPAAPLEKVPALHWLQVLTPGPLLVPGAHGSQTLAPTEL